MSLFVRNQLPAILDGRRHFPDFIVVISDHEC